MDTVRIALISDIHAADAALAAVLEDIERVGVDRVICLGDVATLGPSPVSVIRTLRALDCTCVMGNHDAYLLDRELIHGYTEAPIIIEAVDWCRDQLGPEELAFLQTFVPTAEVALGDGRTLALYHGSPRSHSEDILATTPADTLDEIFAGRRADVLAGGHTHIQMMRQHRGALIVNPGSVGLPFEQYVHGGPPTLLDHAEYATVEAARGGVTVTLRRVAIDARARRAAVEACDNPLREALLASYAAR